MPIPEFLLKYYPPKKPKAKPSREELTAARIKRRNLNADSDRYGTSPKGETFGRKMFRPPVPPTEYTPPVSGHFIYPCISLKELSNFIEVDHRLIRKLCKTDIGRFPVFRDEGIGWMAGMETVSEILKAVHELTGAPVDRVSLLLWMCERRSLIREKERDWRDAQPFYDRKVEGEIIRIARLDDPARTVQARELLERYRGAKRLAGGVNADRKIRNADVLMPSRVDQFERSIEKMIVGTCAETGAEVTHLRAYNHASVIETDANKNVRLRDEKINEILDNATE